MKRYAKMRGENGRKATTCHHATNPTRPGGHRGSHTGAGATAATAYMSLLASPLAQVGREVARSPLAHFLLVWTILILYNNIYIYIYNKIMYVYKSYVYIYIYITITITVIIIAIVVIISLSIATMMMMTTTVIKLRMLYHIYI